MSSPPPQPDSTRADEPPPQPGSSPADELPHRREPKPVGEPRAAGGTLPVGDSPAAGESGRPAEEGSPEGVAGAFIGAIAWGEHTRVWELLSPTGQSVALAVAQANGLDRVAAGRIRDGLANPVELDDFLAQLLGGLRHDLRSVDVGEIRVGSCTQPADGSGARVELLVPSLLPGTAFWPAGSIVLSADAAGTWRVDRLEPILAGPR